MLKKYSLLNITNNNLVVLILFSDGKQLFFMAHETNVAQKISSTRYKNKSIWLIKETKLSFDYFGHFVLCYRCKTRSSLVYIHTSPIISWLLRWFCCSERLQSVPDFTVSLKRAYLNFKKRVEGGKRRNGFKNRFLQRV